MPLWFKCIEMRKTEKDGSERKEKIVLKWEAENAEGLSIAMKFDSELDAKEFLEDYGLNLGVGERMQVEIKPPRRLGDFEKEVDRDEGKGI